MNNVSNYIYKNDGIYSISILVKREKTYKQCVDNNYSRHYSVSCKKTQINAILYLLSLLYYFEISLQFSDDDINSQIIRGVCISSKLLTQTIPTVYKSTDYK